MPTPTNPHPPGHARAAHILRIVALTLAGISVTALGTAAVLAKPDRHGYGHTTVVLFAVAMGAFLVAGAGGIIAHNIQPVPAVGDQLCNLRCTIDQLEQDRAVLRDLLSAADVLADADEPGGVAPTPRRRPSPHPRRVTHARTVA